MWRRMTRNECTRVLDVRLTAQAEALAVRARLAAYVALAAVVAFGLATLAVLVLFYRRRVVNLHRDRLTGAVHARRDDTRLMR